MGQLIENGFLTCSVVQSQLHETRCFSGLHRGFIQAGRKLLLDVQLHCKQRFLNFHPCLLRLTVPLFAGSG